MRYQNLLFKILDRCRNGSLVIEADGEIIAVFGKEESIFQSARIIVRNDRFYERVLLGADIGLGESYIDGDWDSPDLTRVIAWFVENQRQLAPDALSRFKPLLSRIYDLRERWRHLRNRNTLSQSRRNIEAHYDLGNEFYGAFLDESMMYSSAYFTSESDSLQEAQREKIDRLCRKLNLQAEDRVLEIGCGWGGFAIHAAREYGCEVVGLTLSPRQLAYAREEVWREGLQDRVDLRLQDYRTVKGQFDKIASIEMIEAVGHDYLPSYFESLDRLLAPGGLAAIQAIISGDHRYEAYRRRSDFIRKQIFPGSHLPSIRSLFDAKPEEADLNLYHMESFGLHYANTLRLWRERFEENWEQIEPLGFDEAFRRKWNFYLSYCEAGFAGRHINVSQLVFGRMNATSFNYEKAERTPSIAREEGSLLKSI